MAPVEAPSLGSNNNRPGCLAGHDELVREKYVLTTGKLVRDRIPQIIRADGAEPEVYVADPAEYRERLRAKLAEEVAEYMEADETDAPEELADVLEVAFALAADLGVDPTQLEKIRASKAEQRGGFSERIVWTGNR
ncbi:nucleoside triphosphate pyrophosphohydrolase [Streptomyces sp. NRRL S-237]|uniref:nucleoside triphosphate pyrophosphohydrolase n=1 Tax=Streptomyces sp. NRRL S-237 TaxID=1463895 RepID=UPI001F266B5F|nr:nucleoside triphosphate pyrophosphohydrolase [Streptomyces sp. NRRL S-237]